MTVAQVLYRIHKGQHEGDGQLMRDVLRSIADGTNVDSARELAAAVMYRQLVRPDEVRDAAPQQ